MKLAIREGRARRLAHRLYRGLARGIVPGLENSQYAYTRALRERRPAGPRWLDLGCGRHLFPPWMPAGRGDLEAIAAIGPAPVGIDRDLPSLRENRTLAHRIHGDLDALPLRDGSFDLVTANMVVEHLRHPERALAEMQRVLRPGGIVILHTPNLMSPLVRLASLLPDRVKTGLARLLEGRRPRDVFPACYRLNTARRIRKLAGRCGLVVAEIRHVDSTPVSVMLGPLVLLELLWIRLLRLGPLGTLRTDLVAVLQRPARRSPTSSSRIPSRRSSEASQE